MEMRLAGQVEVELVRSLGCGFRLPHARRSLFVLTLPFFDLLRVVPLSVLFRFTRFVPGIRKQPWKGITTLLSRIELLLSLRVPPPSFLDGVVTIVFRRFECLTLYRLTQILDRPVVDVASQQRSDRLADV
ncbi:hypothetical protein BU52_19620 [Streptomyces toyocaensis]|uniref:Uncharacterized protein n=1 Tax=Streptomyces toyocaensis TaxID=55952 RepID=A0A081XPH8_STRTO|nr:hypothetical protein BU52_19620 [Streptomyces toyocaensis]